MSIMRDIIVALAAIATAIAAWFGLSTWQRELKGRAEFDAARRVLTALYKLQYAVDRLRYPFIQSQEKENQYYQDHWKFVHDAFSEMRVAGFEGKALWGEEFSKNVEDIEKWLAELKVAIDRRLEEVAQGTPYTDDDKRRQIIEKKLYSTNVYSIENGDEFGNSLKEVIKRVEKTLRPHVEKPGPGQAR